MPEYICEKCNYRTIIKTQYKRHLETLKHKKNHNNSHHKMEKGIFLTPIDSNLTPVDSNMTPIDSNLTPIDSQKYICEYCDVSFSRKNNLIRHQKNRCRLLREHTIIKKLEEINKKNILEIEIKDKEYKIKEAEIEIYKKEIEKLHQKIEILLEQKASTTIINIDKQINLNNYGNEDLSHISSVFKDNLLKIPYIAIPKMIEEVHFSDKKPENKNIKLTNKKDNLVKVYQENKWIFKDKKATISNLLENKYNMIDDHYEEKEEKTEFIEKQYQKFRELYKNADKDLHNELRADCELLLLNNR